MPLWRDIGTGWQIVRNARVDHPHPALLCCPGPSLPAMDLRGPGRTVVALNTAFPKIQPDVWIGTDRSACFDASLWHGAFTKITRRFDDDNARYRWHPNVYFADVDDTAPVEEMFLRRGYDAHFVWPKNSLIFAIHFLIWSGHKRIHFIGCDMGGEKDYHDDRVLTPSQHAANRALMDGQVKTLRRLTPTAARNGVRFISSTEKSPLNEFMPYLPIEEAMEQCNNSIQHRPVLNVRDAERHFDRHVVLVLKSGGDFRPEHVARLVPMLPECSITLLTDLTDVDYPYGVHAIPLRHGWPAWWSKMELFNPAMGFHDKPFLFTDLDVTIRELPDSFFNQPRSVVMAPYRNEEWARSCGNIQTNLMLLHPTERAAVWARWIQDPVRWMREYRSDQEFVDSCGIQWSTWQDLLPDAVVSYKQNVQAGASFDGSPIDEAKIKVIAYHGRPRPWEVEPQV